MKMVVKSALLILSISSLVAFSMEREPSGPVKIRKPSAERERESVVSPRSNSPASLESSHRNSPRARKIESDITTILRFEDPDSLTKLGYQKILIAIQQAKKAGNRLNYNTVMPSSLKCTALMWILVQNNIPHKTQKEMAEALLDQNIGPQLDALNQLGMSTLDCCAFDDEKTRALLKEHGFRPVKWLDQWNRSPVQSLVVLPSLPLNDPRVAALEVKKMQLLAKWAKKHDNKPCPPEAVLHDQRRLLLSMQLIDPNRIPDLSSGTYTQQVGSETVIYRAVFQDDKKILCKE